LAISPKFWTPAPTTTAKKLVSAFLTIAKQKSQGLRKNQGCSEEAQDSATCQRKFLSRSTPMIPVWGKPFCPQQALVAEASGLQ